MSDERMSREEFGAALFQAVQLNAERLQAEKTASIFEGKHMPNLASKYRAQAARCAADLEAILTTTPLPPADVRRLLAMR
jgi:hypothetical protein